MQNLDHIEIAQAEDYVFSARAGSLFKAMAFLSAGGAGEDSERFMKMYQYGHLCSDEI